MKKKNLFVCVLSVMLALVMAVLPSLQAAAEGSQDKYISEVRIGVGKTAEEAAASLDGYTILQSNRKDADLNQSAGGGIGSKGDRVVYLGYKTTNDKADAITDLAVMNMKGGYSVKDYEVLMEQQMTEQIIPFVNNFLAAIKEYRENYHSDLAENKARATYVHDMLNNLTDDDCGGAGLGDLLLNETKYEMGDAAYDALSDEEKAEHADILTIIAQSNGKATLMMENLLTRAADTNEDTWIERFAGTTYDDLLGLYPDLLPSDAAQELAKAYGDDAGELLAMWDALKEQPENYDASKARLEKLSEKDLSRQRKIVAEYDPETATDRETEAYLKALAEITVVSDTIAALYADVILKEFLSSVAYADGTLADFFMQDYKTIADNITVLYPLVASLSEGQRAGLQFVTLSDLVMISMTDSEGYKDEQLNGIAPSSIYENVDRGIYQKGGVALTSEALRAHSAEEIAAEDSALSSLSILMLRITAGAAIAFGVTAVARLSMPVIYSVRKNMIEGAIEDAQNSIDSIKGTELGSQKNLDVYEDQIDRLKRDLNVNNEDGLMARFDARSSVCNKLMLGAGIVMVVLAAVSLYFSYRDLVDYYNVEYSPIPRYMVDEKDITAYNAKGEAIVIKNQAAYYKAVECNRAQGDEWYDVLGVCADLNGTVGRQWLALYTVKNENMAPILASSLKAVIGFTDIPPDYTTGVHMFGSSAAYNLNNTQLVWNNEAKSVFIYFRAEKAPKTAATGSVMTTGTLVLTGVAGLAVGVLGAVCVTTITKKKKAK